MDRIPNRSGGDPTDLGDRSRRWFLGRAPRQWAETILFCLPNAGGGAASYVRWQGLLPARISVAPVQLPGRENRVDEPPCFDPAELAEAVYQRLDRPYALYGHSMGGVLAFDLVHRLLRLGAPPPRCLYLGASHPPQLECDWARRWDELPENELLAEVVALGGVPAAVLDNDAVRRRVLRVLRADLDWLRGHRPLGRTEVAVVAVAGEHDPLAPPEVMRRWESLTSGRFTLRTVRGGHLFHLADPRSLTALIAEDL